jgi:peptide/nickel transport system substrate-binding protein
VTQDRRARAHRAHAHWTRTLHRSFAFALFVAGLCRCAGGTRDASSTATSDAGTPERGGTLKIIGSADIDHLATASGYYAPTTTLMRTFTRQLVTFPIEPKYDDQVKLVADLATIVPTKENGGISADGMTVTFHIRRGVTWDTKPPRDVTAQDMVRAIRLLCNPVSPVGAPGYYSSTMVGMQQYCDAFAKIPGTAADIKRFVTERDLAGVRATDDSTLVFTLLQPTPDFLYTLILTFGSPVPAEYLEFLPDSPEHRAHTISCGPYRITRYITGREINVGRNPVWDPATDPIRKAYVDSMQIVQGVSQQSVQQQLEAGTADISWDQVPPTVDMAALIASKDPNLILGPPGPHYIAQLYMSINVMSNNVDGAFKKLKVRQALEFAVDRFAVTQIYGGPEVAKPHTQAILTDVAGYRPEWDPYPTPGNRGDPAKARQLLTEAGYPNGVPVKLLYRTSSVHPMIAQTVQASLEKAGFAVTLLPATASDFYAKYLQNPENAKRGVWDVGIAAWFPDWFGINGRAMTEVLFDGRTIGPNSQDYGGYNSDDVNRLIDQALSAPTEAASFTAWTDAATRVIEDAAIVPLVEYKQATYHSARTKNCVFSLLGFNCDLTAVWLQGAGAGHNAPK